ETAPEDAGPSMEETDPEPSEEGTADDSDTGVPVRDNKVLQGEAAEKTKHYIDGIIRDMNLEGTSRTDIKGNEIRIDIESPTAAKLIGKRGATLNALQEVAQNYFNSIHRSYGIIILDVEDYREKRRETLENLAMNMSKKALRSNGPVRLEPMPSFERKIMHRVLSDIENIETYSEGSEPNRYLVIEKKEKEYCTMQLETISSISTPVGEGAIAIVRLSGVDAVEIADTLYKGAGPLSSVDSHTINYGHIVDPETGESVEEDMAAVMRAPKTL